MNNNDQTLNWLDEQAVARLVAKGCVVARGKNDLVQQARDHGLYVARTLDELTNIAAGEGFWVTNNRETVATIARDLGFIVLTPAQFDVFLGASDLDLNKVTKNVREERRNILQSIRAQTKETQKLERQLNEMHDRIDEDNEHVDAISNILEELPE
jgi:hypothetical protein